MVEWRIFEVKQHKYKLVLGWMTIWLVVHLIRHLSFLREKGYEKQAKEGTQPIPAGSFKEASMKFMGSFKGT